MLDISKFLRGDIVCRRFTCQRYRVVSVDGSRVLVVPAEKARCFTRDNIALSTLHPPSTRRIMAKYKAVFDKRVLLLCHVGRSGNMSVASTSAANGRKIDKFHKGHEVAYALGRRKG